MPTWPTKFFRNNGDRRSSRVSVPVGKPAYTLIYSTGTCPWKISWEYLSGLDGWMAKKLTKPAKNTQILTNSRSVMAGEVPDDIYVTSEHSIEG